MKEECDIPDPVCVCVNLPDHPVDLVMLPQICSELSYMFWITPVLW